MLRVLRNFRVARILISALFFLERSFLTLAAISGEGNESCGNDTEDARHSRRPCCGRTSAEGGFTTAIAGGSASDLSDIRQARASEEGFALGNPSLTIGDAWSDTASLGEAPAASGTAPGIMSKDPALSGPAFDDVSPGKHLGVNRAFGDRLPAGSILLSGGDAHWLCRLGFLGDLAGVDTKLFTLETGLDWDGSTLFAAISFQKVPPNWVSLWHTSASKFSASCEASVQP